MKKYRLTWLEGRVSYHESEKSLNEVIADMSVGVGYHIGDCLKSAEEVTEVENAGQSDATAQSNGDDGKTERDGSGGSGSSADAGLSSADEDVKGDDRSAKETVSDDSDEKEQRRARPKKGR